MDGYTKIPGHPAREASYYCVHVFVGTTVISLLGSMMHFVYRWTGCSEAVGLFCAVNESVFEHVKIMLFPILLWWACTGVAIYGTGWHCLSATAWAAYVALGVLLAMNGVATACGYESLGYDISIFVLSIIAGQACGARCFAQENRIIGHWEAVCAGVLVAMLVVVLLAFTYMPPRWAYMFQDHNTMQYGPPANCSVLAFGYFK